MAKKNGGASFNWCGLVTLLLGLYFLGVDLKLWPSYFSWWSAAFVMLGLCCLHKGSCMMCKA
ncbi:hypothetical protein HZA97_03750 [Candidatus Woesearchaeota archaeon]|nr:hypothetical protein [Candidatus Woesearchaeota archaeon]